MNPINDFIEELEDLGRSKNTLRLNLQVLNKFQKSCNGKDVLLVNDDDVRKFIHDMRNQNLKDQTISDNIQAVERFYTFLIEIQKYGLNVNPAKRLSNKLLKKKVQTKRPLKSLDEISTFIRNIHNVRDRAIIVLLAKTAIRNGELVALDVDDIDIQKEVISINKHIIDLNSNSSGKGRKNGNETMIPLDDETIRTLKFYLMARPKTKDRGLFISSAGNRLNLSDIARIVKNWAVKLNFGIDSTDTDKKIVPHFFRAWATYTLQMSGLNPSIVDYIRGDVASTIRGFYFNQVLPFDVIRKEYLKAVPKFGI